MMKPTKSENSVNGGKNCQNRRFYPQTGKTFEQSDMSETLQYSAKANIAPDSTFQKEIKDIKQTAEQALVNALRRFHKRRLDSLRNKLESV